MENRRIERNNRKVDKKRRTITLIKTFILDIVIAGLCLVIFALFHHVIPASKATVGRQLPAPTQQITQAVTETGTETTASADPSPSQGPSDNSTAVLNNGFFPEKYTDGEPVRTDNSFVGRNVSVTLSKVEYKPGTYYYFADIYLRDVKYLRNVFATGEFVQGKAGWVKDMTEGKNAVIAINGDYCGGHPQGQVVRDGLLYRDKVWEDVCVLYYDGVMETYTGREFDLDQAAERGIWQMWSFGPMLLDNGETMEKFNCTVNPANPRTAIGYFEPGHYCFIVVEGRTDSSDGLTTKEMSALMKELGCKAAYNLDGGGSSQMVYGGELLNFLADGGRRVSDAIYITDEVNDQ